MDCQYIAFRDTRSFSPFFLDYIERHEALRPFYSAFPEATEFRRVIETKRTHYPLAVRQALCSDLLRQYGDLKLQEPVRRHLDLLRKDTTFTVTTGHQLNLFTGPLYVIYKIVTVINACRKLKVLYPEFDFVPVYWMASEDHDFAEIDHFRLYGQTYRWDSGQRGAVGRMKTTGLKAWMDQIPGDIRLFKDAYMQGKTLSEAVRMYMTALFGEEGLVVIDADSRELKKFLGPVMESDLFRHGPKKDVDATSALLKEAGYEASVHARDVNFFYLDGDRRERIEADGENFVLVDSKEKITASAVRKIVKDEPEKLSPNVILRPLYQEIILPNLAYVGGPAESLYWLQLKSTFDRFELAFPVILPRNSALIVDPPSARKWTKTGLPFTDLFLDKPALLNAYARKNGRHRLAFDKEKAEMTAEFAAIRNEATALDATLGPLVDAELKRSLGSLQKIEHKMLRAEKRLLSDRLRQVEAVKDSLFPGGSLQERTDNFLNYYQQNPQFIKNLLSSFDPFRFTLNLLFVD